MKFPGRDRPVSGGDTLPQYCRPVWGTSRAMCPPDHQACACQDGGPGIDGGAVVAFDFLRQIFPSDQVRTELPIRVFFLGVTPAFAEALDIPAAVLEFGHSLDRKSVV